MKSFCQDWMFLLKNTFKVGVTVLIIKCWLNIFI